MTGAYDYMRHKSEAYYLANTYWIIANGHDSTGMPTLSSGHRARRRWQVHLSRWPPERVYERHFFGSQNHCLGFDCPAATYGCHRRQRGQRRDNAHHRGRRLPTQAGGVGTDQPRNNFAPIGSRFTSEAVVTSGVRVDGILSDNSPGHRVHDPDHPDADEEGFVTYPNVNIVTEMTDMLSATRSYEANVTVFNALKAMALKALDIGRNG